MAANLTYDLDHLIKKMFEDLRLLNSAYMKINNNPFSYEIVSVAYDYLCHLLQIYLIKKHIKSGNKKVSFEFLYDIGKVNYLIEFLDGEVRERFIYFLKFYKDKMPAEKKLIETITFLAQKFNNIIQIDKEII